MTRPGACRFTWCGGDHPEHEIFVVHRGVIGTAALQGDELTVSLGFLESKSGDGIDVGPAVELRWPWIEGEYPEEPPESGLDGVDMLPSEALVLARLLARAHALASAPADLGPVLETHADARTAAAAVWETARASRDPGALTEANHSALLDACQTAGIYLGGYEHRIVRWLAGWEPETAAVIAALITRANGALR
jgi:hypothetical protein